MKKLRVIVCGSTFGQYYIRALQTVPDEFEVVGLLANGSNRSKLCADFYHVPLYTQIEDIPEVDIACVVIRSRAVGGSGTDIAEYFLNKKVHVIQEQPIHPKDMEVCYRAAKKNHVLFQMGDLYPNLIEVENFIKCARYLNKKENPLYLRASFSPQVSYPAIDIISRIVPSIHTWKIKSITKELGPFDILMGEIGKTPIFIEYHNQVDPRDPDNYMHLLHSFTLFYSTGKLVLEDTFIELNNLDDLNDFDIDTNGFQKLQHVHEKWTKYFTNNKENELISKIRKDNRFQMLSDTALINVGITTGNNKYFSVNDKTVRQYELEKVVRPLIGRSAHAHSVYFNEEDWKENVDAGKAAYLIDFPEVEYERYPDKHKEYIHLGEVNGENEALSK